MPRNVFNYNPRADALLSIGQAMLEASQPSLTPGRNLLTGVPGALAGVQQRAGANQMASLQRQVLEQNLATQQDEARRKAAQEEARRRIFDAPQNIGMLAREAGTPEAEIPGRVLEAQRGLFGAAAPDAAMGVLGQRLNPPPPEMGTGYDPETGIGTWQVMGPGVVTDLPAEPKLPAHYGDVLFDKQVGKFYQENLDTGKRDWVSTPSGIDISIDPDGGFTFSQGPGAGAEGGLGGKTEQALETRRLNAIEGLSRMYAIQDAYKPEFQQIPTRWGIAWDAFKERANISDLTPEEQTTLVEMTVFRRRSIENLNLYIKEITGAQMSEKEAERLGLAMPDAGVGVFEGDSPTVFEAKMNDIIKSLTTAIARYDHYKKNGLTLPNLEAGQEFDISLEQMETMMRARGVEIRDSIITANPGMDVTTAAQQAVVQLRTEFGLPERR